MLVSEIAYYHMKVVVLQTQDESPGDRFECCSHLGDILANICNALYHLWKERERTDKWIFIIALSNVFQMHITFCNIIENMGFLRSSEQQEQHLAVPAAASLIT